MHSIYFEIICFLADNYKALSKKLGLFDIVLIKIDGIDYFGMVVHVEQVKDKFADENKTSDSNSSTDSDKKNLKFDLQITIGIYVSYKCSVHIQQRQEHTGDKKLPLFKLSNITSSRRMISAINNLHEWSQHRSLLKPMIEDIYFQLPENYDPLNVSPLNGFNETQSKTIVIAECMLDDMFDRMHIVHGPPGMYPCFFLESTNSTYCCDYRYRQKSNNCWYCVETTV